MSFALINLIYNCRVSCLKDNSIFPPQLQIWIDKLAYLHHNINFLSSKCNHNSQSNNNRLAGDRQFAKYLIKLSQIFYSQEMKYIVSIINKHKNNRKFLMNNILDRKRL